MMLWILNIVEIILELCSWYYIWRFFIDRNHDDFNTVDDDDDDDDGDDDDADYDGDDGINLIERRSFGTFHRLRVFQSSRCSGKDFKWYLLMKIEKQDRKIL